MNKYYLGIDIGSVAIAIAVIDDREKILHTSYNFHKGQILEKLSIFLNKIELSDIEAIAQTSSTPPVVKNGISVDSRIAFITAARHFHRRAGWW